MPVCPGACCAFASSACVDTRGAFGCSAEFDGVFQGDLSRCADEGVECRSANGACCLLSFLGYDHACVPDTTEFECRLTVGTFLADRSCDDAPCATTICPGTEGCCESHRTPGCSDADCCRAVCAVDPNCCSPYNRLAWDEVCVDIANRRCGDGNGGYCAYDGADLNDDGAVNLLDYRLFQNSFRP